MNVRTLLAAAALLLAQGAFSQQRIEIEGPSAEPSTRGTEAGPALPPEAPVQEASVEALFTPPPADPTLRDSSAKKPGFFKRLVHYFEESNEDKTTVKKFDFSIIGGPHYSSDVGFGLGMVAAGLYRVDPSDLSIPPSTVSLYGDVTTTGFFLLGIRGNTLLQGAKYRIDYKTYFYSFPSSFWGIGYEAATYNPESEYTRLQYDITVDLSVRLARNFYLGITPRFNFVNGKQFSDIDYLEGQSPRVISTGLGAFVQYDSRDFIPSPWKGLYLRLEQRLYPMFMGNKTNFNSVEFTGDVYKQVWKGAVLAYDLHGEFHTGGTPWTMLALMGGSSRMRGYYAGRYRDNNLIETQLELRQKIYGRSGAALWVGAANVFPAFDKFDWSHTLPNYGIGYRWEFKKRVNVRLDYGIGKKGQSGFLFNINEAF